MIPTGNGFAFQKYGRNIIIRLTLIGKEEVLKGDLNKVNALLECVTRELKTSGVIYPWNMTISGYDSDPRSLAQIPEVVAWFRTLQEKYPFFPIFLSPFVLNAYLLSQLDMEVVKTIKGSGLSDMEKEEINAMAAILNKYEPGLGDDYRKQMGFETQYRVNLQQVQELNNQISFAAGIYLDSHNVGTAVREKLLKDAFQRINQALDFS